ncbi:hypothetical protein [Propioniferax innocua]|uniref:Cell division protein FtsL n=1 Tax=Propioniferax innocua TaxID=1753 RepID=A0A542ZBJ5_9ACTN|nr:hypothetical protein [Propioniferax innocua]TQL57708.1 cell division protein FtsL [Propioniferax innocua]
MSVSPLPTTSDDPRGGGAPLPPSRPRLALVPASQGRMGRASFLVVLGGLLVAGLVGLLFLNTHLQAQAMQANDLRAEAVELSYREGELKQQVIEASSTGEVTRKASKLGLRPNDHIAFVDLRTGEISGDVAPSDGKARPESVILTSDEEDASQESKAQDYADTRRSEAEDAAAAARERAEQLRPQGESYPANPGADQQNQGQGQPENPAFPGSPAPDGPSSGQVQPGQPGPPPPAPEAPEPGQQDPAPQGPEQQATEFARGGQ